MDRLTHQRRRAVLSCLECRRRKIKCSRTEPCAQCVLSSHPRCVYNLHGNAPVIQEQQQQRGHVLPLNSTLNKASEISPAPSTQENPGTSADKSDTDRLIGRAVIEVANVNVPSVQVIHNSSQLPKQNAQETLQDVLTRLQVAEKPSVSSSIRELTVTSRDILERQSGLQNSQIILHKSKIMSWSHWISTAHEVLEPVLLTETWTDKLHH
jgi:hypothetical protein